MSSPFSMLYRDRYLLIKAGQVTGSGEVVDGDEIHLIGKLATKHGQYRSSSGDLVDYQGSLRYDHTCYDVSQGDTLVAGDISYRVVDILETGGLAGVPKKRRAILKWLV